jgi:hypothetical protein
VGLAGAAIATVAAAAAAGSVAAAAVDATAAAAAVVVVVVVVVLSGVWPRPAPFCAYCGLVTSRVIQFANDCEIRG